MRTTDLARGLESLIPGCSGGTGEGSENETIRESPWATGPGPTAVGLATFRSGRSHGAWLGGGVEASQGILEARQGHRASESRRPALEAREVEVWDEVPLG